MHRSNIIMNTVAATVMGAAMFLFIDPLLAMRTTPAKEIIEDVGKEKKTATTSTKAAKTKKAVKKKKSAPKATQKKHKKKKKRKGAKINKKAFLKKWKTLTPKQKEAYRKKNPGAKWIPKD